MRSQWDRDKSKLYDFNGCPVKLIRDVAEPDGHTWRVKRCDMNRVRDGEIFNIPPRMLDKLSWEPYKEVMLVRIPVRFYDDHESRDLDTPVAHKRTKTHVWIDKDDPAVPELLDDARYYSTSEGPGMDLPGLRRSAQATVKILKEA